MHDFLNRRCQHTPFGLRTVKNRIVIFFFSKQKTQINQSINRQTLTKITESEFRFAVIYLTLPAILANVVFLS